MDIYEMSPTMREALSKPTGKGGYNAKYPWKTLEPGKVFIVPDDGSIQLGSLTSLAYRMGKKLNKVFKVVNHPDKKVFEVGRIDGVTG